VKAPAFDYLMPREVADALKALQDEDAKLIAGGQSLGPMLNLRLVRPRLVVDVSRIEELRLVQDRGDSLWIGAGITHAEIEDARLGLPSHGMLRFVAAGIAYRSVRNRGTIGGSLAHADPAADWPLALAALDAKAHLRSARGQRLVPVDAFVLGAFATQLAEDELILGIQVPKLAPSARWGYYKFCRKTGEFPEASAAVVVDRERAVSRVYIGALAGAPRRCDALERRLRQGEAWDAAECGLAVQHAAPELDAVERRMHAATLARAIRHASPS
jgi:carbon-monoxide dehydrogenase medium subunit